MTGALTYGAAATDNIVLLNGANPPTPVGLQAANPVSVRVLASDGVTPVSGATVGWSSTNGVQLSACSGALACAAITDQDGYAGTWLTAAAAGTAIVTATLAPGVYSPAKSVSGTLSATQSYSDIGVSTPSIYVSQGATVGIPVNARVLSNGIAQSSVAVNFHDCERRGKSQRRQCGDQCERLRYGDAVGGESQHAGAGKRMRGSGKFSVRGVLCQSGSTYAAGPAAGFGRRADLCGTVVSTSGGAGSRFGDISTSGDGCACEFSDYRAAAWRDGADCG